MKNIIPYIVIIFILFLGFFIHYSLSLEYERLYQIPFGKVDVDRYLVMIDNPGGYFDDPVHYLFVKTVWVMMYLTGYDKVHTLTVLIPVVTWFGFGLAAYTFMQSYLMSRYAGTYATIIMMYGTYITFFMGFVGLWAQSFSLIFYYLALAYYIKGLDNIIEHKITSIVFGLISILYHPYTIGFFILFLFSHYYGILQLKKALLMMGVGYIALIIVTAYMGQGLIGFTIFSGKYGEPTLYMMFFLYLCPLLYIMAYLGKDYVYRDPELKLYIPIVIILGFIIHISRGLPYALPFISAYAGAWLTRQQIAVKIIIILMFLIWMNSVFYGHVDSMAYEMVAPVNNTRRLDPALLYNMVGVYNDTNQRYVRNGTNHAKPI